MADAHEPARGQTSGGAPLTTPSGSFARRCWAGQARLWQAFWLVLMLGCVVFMTLLVLIAGLAPRDGALGNMLWGSVRIVGIAFLTYALVSVWRCARNTNYAFLGIAARLYVALVVGYLLLEAVRTFTGIGA
jgi:hypothetical protein